MARPKGQPKLGGRQKGTPNRVTTAAKDAIAQAFDRVGGVDGLVDWIEASDDNRKVFYSSIHPKLIPVQVGGDPDNPLNVTVRRIELVAPGGG